MNKKCLNPWDVQSKHIMSIDGKCESLCAGEKRWSGLPPNVCYEIKEVENGKCEMPKSMGSTKQTTIQD